MPRLNRETVLRDQIERMRGMIKIRDGVIRDMKAQVEKERLDGKIHDSSAARVTAIADRIDE